MQRPPDRIGTTRTPISRSRRRWSIVLAPFTFILILFASLQYGWLTLTRGLYLLVGVVEGLLLGFCEAKVTTRQLAKKTQTSAGYWLAYLLGILVFLPFLLIFDVYGAPEIWPYGVYYALPYVTADLAVSSRFYGKFEKEQKVQVFTRYPGYLVWKEPANLTGKFSQLIDCIISRNFTGIFNLASYSQNLVAYMKGNPKLERPTRDFLSRLLEMLKAYRRRMFEFLIAFIVSALVFMTYFFLLASTNSFGLEKVEGGVIVEGQAIALILGIAPAILFFGGAIVALRVISSGSRSRFSTLLASLNPSMLSDLKSLVKPQN